MKHPSRQHGYSLVELLVVLALMGMIALAMSSGISFGGRVWQASARQVDALDRVSSTQEMLRTLFQRVVPRDLDPGIAYDQDLFRGDSVHAGFTASSPSALDASGIARFELRATPRAGKTALVLRWVTISGPQTVQAIDLLDGADEIRISYAHLDQTGAFFWRDDWNDQSGVPALISISVRFPAGSALAWPLFTVRPRISREPTCVYDPVSFGCRHA